MVHSRKEEPAGQEERRQFPRWADGHLAFLRTEHREQLAVTGDLSLGGLQLAVMGTAPASPGQEVTVEVAFERRLLEVRGWLAYQIATEYGCLVGVQFNGRAAAVKDFLALRYACSPEGARSGR